METPPRSKRKFPPTHGQASAVQATSSPNAQYLHCPPPSPPKATTTPKYLPTYLPTYLDKPFWSRGLARFPAFLLLLFAAVAPLVGRRWLVACRDFAGYHHLLVPARHLVLSTLHEGSWSTHTCSQMPMWIGPGSGSLAGCMDGWTDGRMSVCLPACTVVRIVRPMPVMPPMS